MSAPVQKLASYSYRNTRDPALRIVFANVLSLRACSSSHVPSSQTRFLNRITFNNLLHIYLFFGTSNKFLVFTHRVQLLPTLRSAPPNELQVYKPAEREHVLSCPLGYYCPSKDVTLVCPIGHYCPGRTVVPVACRVGMDSCEEGSAFPPRSDVVFIAAFVICVVIGFLVVRAAYFMLSARELRSRKLRNKNLEWRKFQLRRLYSVIKHEVDLGDRHFEGLQGIEHRISIQFTDLSLRLSSGLCVLTGVTGEFEPGRMSAIMGPSGAGKSTFLNALTGRAGYGVMNGKITVNDDPNCPPLTRYRGVTGFVPQDDIVFERLTVYENLMFAARLRSQRDMARIETDYIGVLYPPALIHSLIFFFW